MKIKKVFYVIAFLLIMLHSAHSQVIDYSDITIEKIHKEYIQKGLIPPFYSGPLFISQVNNAADKIDSENRIDSTKKNGVQLALALTPAMQFFSEEVHLESGDRKDANNGIDYTKNILSKPSLIETSALFYNDLGIGGEMQLSFRDMFTGYYFPNNNFDLINNDANFLTRAYIYFEHPSIQLIFGRTNQQMGFIYGDSIFFNNNIPHTDAIKMNLPFGDFFNLHWQITNISAAESMRQKDITTGNDYKDEYLDSKKPDEYGDYFYGFETDDFPSIILNTYQRFGFQNDTIKTGISYSVFIARRNNRFEFIDFVPFAEWHAADMVPNNLAVALDFGFAPSKNVLFDLQVGFDEINILSFGAIDSIAPTIWSVRALMQNTLLTSNIDVLFSTNIGYSHYLWGNYSGITAEDISSNQIAKALYRHKLRMQMYIPYTSPYGPGALWFNHQAVIRFQNDHIFSNFALKPNVSFLLKEIETNLIDTPYEKRSEQAQNMIYSSVSLPMEYQIKNVTASITPSFHVKTLHVPTSTWFELRLAIKAELLVSLFQNNKKLDITFK